MSLKTHMTIIIYDSYNSSNNDDVLGLNVTTISFIDGSRILIFCFSGVRLAVEYEFLRAYDTSSTQHTCVRCIVIRILSRDAADGPRRES